MKSNRKQSEPVSTLTHVTPGQKVRVYGQASRINNLPEGVRSIPHLLDGCLMTVVQYDPLFTLIRGGGPENTDHYTVHPMQCYPVEKPKAHS